MPPFDKKTGDSPLHVLVLGGSLPWGFYALVALYLGLAYSPYPRQGVGEDLPLALTLEHEGRRPHFHRCDLTVESARDPLQARLTPLLCGLGHLRCDYYVRGRVGSTLPCLRCDQAMRVLIG